MELLLIILVAFFTGAYQGAKSAAIAPYAHYQELKTRKEEEARERSGSEIAGIGFGATSAAVGVVTARSLGTATRGFGRGTKAGWSRGWDWTSKKLGRPVDDPKVDATKTPKVEDAPAPAATVEVVITALDNKNAAAPLKDDLDVPDFVKKAIPVITVGEDPAPDFACSVCNKSVVKKKPTRVVPGAGSTAMEAPFSHADGTPLCPAATRDDKPSPDSTEPGLAPVLDIASHKRTAIPAVKNGRTPLTVPITTTTADAANFTGVIAGLEAIAVEATANIDDATADVQRSEAEVANIESLVSNLASLGLDGESLGAINSLIEPFKSRSDAARTRLQAAEFLRGQAGHARELVIRKHSLMKEAHDSTPQAAEKAFYTGD
jgi:hypothetical protein